jgi:hypothetical protein
MRKLILILCIWCASAYAAETDFDCIVVGTSPFSMFEAIYKRCLGNRVLVVEQGSECGGAWKSITICGIPHVDLGCHEFGRDPKVQKFLEEYAGCKMVSNSTEKKSPADGEFYPSQGCYELTHNLERLMHSLGVVLTLNSKLESVFIDTSRSIAEVRINGIGYTTQKLVLTYNSEIKIENPQVQNPASNPHTFYHIGMLIADPTPPRFTYRNLRGNGASRSTNYTPYSQELQGTGKQLITIQVHGQQNLNKADQFFAELKKQGLIAENAQLLQVENYIYRQVPFNQGTLHKLGAPAQAMFEILNTGHISNLGNYVEKWKKAMKPWNESMKPQLQAAG